MNTSNSIRPGGRFSRYAIIVPTMMVIALAFFTGPRSAAAAPCGTSQVLINEIYVHGGLAGATYRNDYVELYNVSASSCDLAGYSIQVSAGNANNFPNVFGFPANSIIPAGGFYLVQFGSGGANGLVLPTPDFTAANDLAVDGKIALVASTVSINGNCASTKAGSIDYVGYGSTNCFLTTATVSPTLTQGIQRKTNGYNTSDNGNDFMLVAASPKNTTAPTSAGVSVSGRLTNKGVPVRSASVTLTDYLGRTTVTSTDSTGSFRFEDVAAGGVYLLGASARGYSFENRVLTIIDSVADIEMTAKPRRRQ